MLQDVASAAGLWQRLSASARSGALLTALRAAGVEADDIQIEGEETDSSASGASAGPSRIAILAVVNVAANASAGSPADAVAEASAIGAALIGAASAAGSGTQARQKEGVLRRCRFRSYRAWD